MDAGDQYTAHKGTRATAQRRRTIARREEKRRRNKNRDACIIRIYQWPNIMVNISLAQSASTHLSSAAVANQVSQDKNNFTGDRLRLSLANLLETNSIAAALSAGPVED